MKRICAGGVCYTRAKVIRMSDRKEHVSGNTRMCDEPGVRKDGRHYRNRSLPVTGVRTAGSPYIRSSRSAFTVKLMWRLKLVNGF
jgi:hypothetical protein